MLRLSELEIAIIGLGYVGLPLAVEFGKKVPVVGLANIRGRLLSVADLAHYVSGHRSAYSPTQKVLCISHNDHYVGLVVDQVLGIQHFNKKSFFSKHEDLDRNLKEYCQGYFHQHNQQWHVFLFSRLLDNPKYMNASIKFIN